LLVKAENYFTTETLLHGEPWDMKLGHNRFCSALFPV